MSHITTIKTEIRDLNALKAACAELGVEFIENQKTYKWFGQVMGDYPLPADITAEQVGKCAHVINVPGVEYEIGVVQTKAGHWTLAYDFWGPGEGLLKKFGPGCQKLIQLYGVHKAIIEARRKWYSVQRKLQSNGSIKLTVMGVQS